MNFLSDVQFTSVQLLSRIWLFAIPWTAVGQASLSITNSQGLCKLMSIEYWVMLIFIYFPQTCLWVSRSLQQRCGSAVACCRVGGAECSSACMEHFEGGHHCLHYLHYLHYQKNNRERTQPQPSTENWIKRFTEHDSAHQSKTQFLPQSFSPIRKLP